MRRAAKTDANQQDIVNALRAAGCSVQSLAAVGRGVPDLLVGRAGVNLLLEVKDGNQPPSSRKLTDEQVVWHAIWKGSVKVVETAEQALGYVDSMT